MEQSTHEIRRRNWMNIINQCKNRSADITAKQWLADNGISVNNLCPNEPPVQTE